MSELEKLLQENLLPLQRYVRFKINNYHDAEDIIQDVCVTATLKYNSLKNPLAFKAWLIGIASHKCNDYYRHKAKDRSIPLEDLSDALTITGRFGIISPNIVRDTLDNLNDNEKQILYLYFFKDFSQEDISKHLAIPIGTVKSRMHYAKEKFKQHYPYHKTSKGERMMKTFPDNLPEYKINPVDIPVFSVVFEELPNWFIVPKIGEEITWASYDMPSRNITDIVHSKATSAAFIHGIEGVEIQTEFKRKKDSAPHIYYAQLTNSHCRWLGESYVDDNGTKHLLTFLDGDDFISAWGYGEDNSGNETHLISRGMIKRHDHTIYTSTHKHVTDVIGRYHVEINHNTYDTVCIIDYFGDGVLTEQYLDSKGKTVLWRRFNQDSWATERYGKLWTEILPQNETLLVNGETYVHWYDCITDYIL